MIQWKNKKIKLNNKIKIMIFIFLEIFLISGTVILCCLIDLDPKSSISIKTQQDTIYIDENGKQVTTSDHNLRDINSKEIKQIGFYKNEQGKIQAVQMPKTVEKVPVKLPPEITSLNSMFHSNIYFNQDISNWNISNITSLNSMFYGAWKFNANISNWDISNVIDMNAFLLNAKKFDQNLSNWNVNKVKTHSNFATGSLIEKDNNKLPKFKN